MAYMNTYNALKAYRKVIDISEINLSFIEDFDVFLRDVRGNEDGGRANKHKHLKTIILDMIKHDLPIKNPYPLFKTPKCKVKETYLENPRLNYSENYMLNSQRTECFSNAWKCTSLPAIAD